MRFPEALSSPTLTFPYLTATNVNMASTLSAGVLARYITDPGLGGRGGGLLLLKKGKQELGEEVTVASWWGRRPC